jgi:hypothetical protein
MAKTRRLNKYVVGKTLTSTSNPIAQNTRALAILQREFPVIIGMPADVQAGLATTSDPQSAIQTAPSGTQILWLSGNYTLTVTLTSVTGVKVVGQGAGVTLIGDLDFVSTTLMDISGINILGNVNLDAASTRNFLFGWQSGGAVNNIPGTANEVVLL